MRRISHHGTLSGGIPQGLGRLTKLKRLVLAGNEHITGGALEIEAPPCKVAHSFDP